MAISQDFLEFQYDALRYERGAPIDELTGLREQSAVIWVDEHQLPQWPGGPGFWRFCAMGNVLRFSKTQSYSLPS